MGLASKLKQEVTSQLGVGSQPSQQTTSQQNPTAYGGPGAGNVTQGAYGQQTYAGGNVPTVPNNQAGYGQTAYTSYGQQPQQQQSQYGSKPGGGTYPPSPYGAQQHNAYGHQQQPQQQQQQQQYPTQHGQHGSYGQPMQQSVSSQYGATPHGSAPYPPSQNSQYGQPNQYGQQSSMMPQQQQGMPQQQQQGMPQQQQQSWGSAAGPMKTTGNNEAQIAAKLQKIIASNNLQAFYDATRFQQVMQRVMNINFDAIASQWKINREIATDLASLCLYDIVFYCDDSGSMAFGDNGERIDDLKFILNRVAEIATLFDDDGIVVRFMNSRVEGNGIRNAAEVNALISQVSFNGMTPLGTQLYKKCIQPMIVAPARGGSMSKPVMIVAITDGEPSENRDIITNVIRSAKDVLSKTKYGPGALALQIAQVGTDQKAQEFLGKLDKDPIVGGMIDCTSNFEMEQMEYTKKGINLTPDLWLLKMCLGAIDPEYDEADE